MSLAEDEHAVGDFGSGGEYEPFGVSVGPRAAWWDLADGDAGVGAGGELIASGDWLQVLNLFAFLNLFFGVFNLLPMDGGHIAIAWFERIRSRSPPALAIPTRGGRTTRS
ncbi:site-2 protease family protein [Planosporangium mesophilum]|nr:site-2 protease family protein [Planosporangium mesophilum]